MYDSSGGGKIFRKYNSVNLAWWHSYKWAALKMWELYAPFLLAPWWHTLYPSGQFHTKPSSFTSLIAHYQYLRLAYPEVRDLLVVLKERMTTAGNACMSQLLGNLQFMFEFAIPTVNTAFPFRVILTSVK
jgi:hypothetical protein